MAWPFHSPWQLVTPMCAEFIGFRLCCWHPAKLFKSLQWRRTTTQKNDVTLVLKPATKNIDLIEPRKLTSSFSLKKDATVLCNFFWFYCRRIIIISTCGRRGHRKPYPVLQSVAWSFIILHRRHAALYRRYSLTYFNGNVKVSCQHVDTHI